ncbi:MAG TPA: glycerol-3-phosphate ABC transporter ATP-binding protein, partial [bacterium]|nr:glycerol-3-phosphate ABC transporter ATP-binding protein [bacterium]
QSTVIYVTHDQMEAMTLGNRIVVLKDGLIQQVGAPLEIYDHPINKFVGGFIGTPPMNFLEGKVVQRDGACYFDQGSFAIRLPDNFERVLDGSKERGVIFGIRPEHLVDIAVVQEKDPESFITANVEVVEPIGAESLWYVKVGTSSLVARVEAHCRAKVNEVKTLQVDVAKAHLFDSVTEQTLLV